MQFSNLLAQNNPRRVIMQVNQSINQSIFRIIIEKYKYKRKMNAIP